MPFITPKKTATAAPVLVWDAFPPPPPEAETWQPDPDSIARPGGLPDPRFNRDSEHDRRSKSFRKEAKLYSATQISIPSPSVNGSSLGRGLGQWPAPAPRSTGYPRDFVQETSPPSPPVEPVAVLETSRKQAATAVKQVARVAGPPKGTMELMSAPNQRRPATPVTSRASVKSASPNKSLLPAWAVRLENALAENALAENTLAASTEVSTRPKTVRKKSIPPHLRNKMDETVKAACPQLSSLSLNPNAKIYEVPVKSEDIIDVEALALPMATADSSIQHAKHDLRMQQELLDRYIVNKQPQTNTIPAPAITVCVPIDHATKIKVLLIRTMEHEMDLGRVAPERELVVMQRPELDRYYDKVCSAHKQWWEARVQA